MLLKTAWKNLFARLSHRHTPPRGSRSQRYFKAGYVECSTGERSIECLEGRALLATISWDGGAGTSNWNDSGNWTGDVLPGATDDVVISVGYSSIVHSGGSNTISSLTSASPITLSGGTLSVTTTVDVSASFSLGGGTLANATTSAGTTITVTNESTLDGVTLNGNVDVTQAADRRLHVRNGLTLNGTVFVGRSDGGTFGRVYFDGTQTIGGSGDFLFGGHGNNLLELQHGTVTIGPNVTVHGQRGNVVPWYSDSVLENQGTIVSDVAGGRIDIYSGGAGRLINSGVLSVTAAGAVLYAYPSGGWSNSGTIEASGGGRFDLNYGGTNTGTLLADGGTLYVTHAWTSHGSLTASNGGTLNLWGTWNNAGAMTAATGGTVNLEGTWSNSITPTVTSGTLNLHGNGTWTTATLQADAASAVNFRGTFTTGGNNLALGGGGRFGLSGGTLAASTLTLDPGLALIVDSESTLDGVTLNGNVDVTQAADRRLHVRNGLTLNGTVFVGRSDGGTFGRVYFDGTQTIGGSGDFLFGGHGNNLLEVDRSTVTLGPNVTVHGQRGNVVPWYSDSVLENQGTIVSDVAGGRIDIFSGGAGRLINSGTLSVTAAGAVLYAYPSGGWSNSGTIVASGGGRLDLNYGGTNTGTLLADGGTLYVTHAWTSHGSLTASNGGTLNLWGTWNNSGAITANSGGTLNLNDNRTNSGPITATTAGIVNINGSWSNSSPLTASDGGVLNFNGTWSNSVVPTLTGGILNLQGSGTWSAASIQGDADSVANFYGAFTTSGSNLDVLGGLAHIHSGSTLSDGTMTVGSAARLQFSGGTLNDFTIINNGDATWTSGNVSLINGSAFSNAGTFDDQTDGTFGSNDVVCPIFTNSGTFIKSGGNGVTELRTEFLNSGLVEIQRGVLNLGCGYIQTGGSTVVTGGSITGPIEVQGGDIQGPISGNVTNSGDVSVPPSPTPTTTTSYTQTEFGSLTEQIGGLVPGVQYGQIQVSGDVNLAGSLYVTLINGFRPHLADQFLIISKQSSGPINGTFAGMPETSTVWSGPYGFEISYSGGDGNDVTLTVIVAPPENTPPIANDDEIAASEDAFVTFDVLANDEDDQNNIVASLTATLSSPSSGTLIDNGNGSFTFDPAGAFENLATGESAQVSFDYQIEDAFGETDTAAVFITIHGVNDAPEVTDAGSVTVDEGQTVTNSGTWSDIDASDVVTLSASVGLVTKNANGTWSWSLNTNDGPDDSQTVVITANDGHGGITTTRFALTINNLAPTANADSATVGEDDGATVIDVLANDTDPAGPNDPLSITGVNVSGTRGDVTLSGGQVHYSADGFFEALGAGETDIDSFDYTITDGDGGNSTATATVTVFGQNDAPTIIGTLADVTVNQNGANTVIDLTGIFNDVDANDSLTFTAVSSESSLVAASVAGSALTLDYQAHQSGIALITITAMDGSGATVSLSFQVTVNSDDVLASGLKAAIQQLVTQGKITSAKASEWSKKLDSALASYDDGDGNITAAVNKLHALKNDIVAQTKGNKPKLTSVEANLLVGLIDELADAMTE